jgi:hypothetical protein
MKGSRTRLRKVLPEREREEATVSGSDRAPNFQGSAGRQRNPVRGLATRGIRPDVNRDPAASPQSLRPGLFAAPLASIACLAEILACPSCVSLTPQPKRE